MNSNAFSDIDIRRAVELASSGDSMVIGTVSAVEDGLDGLDVPQAAGMDIFGGSGSSDNPIFKLVADPDGNEGDYLVTNNRIYFGRKLIKTDDDVKVTFSLGTSYVVAKIDHSSAADPELSVEVLTSYDDSVSTLFVTYRLLYEVNITITAEGRTMDVLDCRLMQQIPAYLQ